MPAVSVLLPCYQAEATLAEALRSLTNQTWRDFEIVAVNDGSSDHTQALLDSWKHGELRLRVVNTPHNGIVAALNAGLAACNADLVARMDSDDRCYPRRLQAQFEYLQSHSEVSVLGCQVQAFPVAHIRDGLRTYLDWQNGLLDNAGIRREMFVESPFVHPSVMFRAQAVRNIGGYEDHGWAEDYDLWLRLYLAGANFARLPEMLLEWRDLPERLTRKDGRYSPENFRRAKAFYLAQGPLRECDAVIIWGAGRIGKRIGRALEQIRAPLRAYVDIDPRKIGRTRRGLPVLHPADLSAFRQKWNRAVVLVAVGIPGARSLIREQLQRIGMDEGQDWFAVA